MGEDAFDSWTFARTDNVKIWAAYESYGLKMNIIAAFSFPVHVL